MQINLLSRMPRLTADTMLIVFAVAETKKILDTLIDEEEYKTLVNSSDITDSEAKNYHLTPKSNIVILGLGKQKNLKAEKFRKAVYGAVNKANELKIKEVVFAFPGLDSLEDGPLFIQIISEISLLTNYQFLKYKTKPQQNSLQKVSWFSENKKDKEFLEKGRIIAESTIIARNLVNEPVITLTAEALANSATKLADQYGFSAEVFTRGKIESLKMGGLLAVNAGSIDPPTFTILEWKPSKPVNKKPIVLVGKGVVFDTGGLSLKPTQNSMDSMKSDMAGAAAVIGTFCGAAALDLKVHIIGLIPATDNRPGEKAYTPGDVITMFDGSTVEVLNTDAEGRMILGDALAYAKKYKPELVIDLATLTGAAYIALGTLGIAMMSTADQEAKQKLIVSGEKVHERMVDLPLWEEYEEMFKSDIADKKNIGNGGAGAIIGGKFLETFTDYPWIHLDIAGPAFISTNGSYRGKNGTGTGVRLLLDFLSNY
jgi:leucyl aminopeptidase